MVGLLELAVRIAASSHRDQLRKKDHSDQSLVEPPRLDASRRESNGRVTRNRRRWTNFTLEEQDKILAAKRSNNELDCSKLVNALPDLEIPEIHVAVDRCCARMKKNLDAQGWKPTPRGS